MKPFEVSRRPRCSHVLSVAVLGLALTQTAGAAEKLTPGSLLASSCAACHNTEGRSVAGTPVLAGLTRQQFVGALQEFKAGTRKATVMHRHAKGYTEQEIELLADYFSAQKR